MEIDIALKEWWKEWMGQILEVEPLESKDLIENVFTYEVNSYTFLMTLKVTGENILLYSNGLPQDYPGYIIPFSVQGKTTDITGMVDYINENIDTIIQIEHPEEQYISSEEVSIIEPEAPAEPVEEKKKSSKKKV